MKHCYGIKVKKLRNQEISQHFMNIHLLKVYFNHWKLKSHNISNKVNSLEEVLIKYQLNIKLEVILFFYLIFFHDSIKL